MSQRKSHIYHLTLSSTLNLTFEETISLANSLKISTQRYVKKNNYSCLMLISVSCINPKIANIKVGFRGKKSIVKNRKHKNSDPITNPHLHIVLFANPGETISKYIQKYIENKFKDKYIWSSHVYQENDWRNYVKYDMKQSIKERTISNRIEVLPQELVEEFLNHCEFHNFLRNGNTPVFKDISNEYFEKYHNKKSVVENDPFTLLENNKIDKTLITSDSETILENTNNYNVIYSNNKLNRLDKLDELDKLDKLDLPYNSNRIHIPILSNYSINSKQVCQLNSS